MSTTPPEYPEYSQAGEGSYTQHPGTPAGEMRPPAAVVRPESIQKAVRLMRAGAALGVISLIVQVTNISGSMDKLADQLRKNGRHFSESTIDAVQVAVVVGGVVFSILVALIWLWMAWKNGQGRSWARIVATVLGGYYVMSVGFSLLLAKATTRSLVFALVYVILGLSILFLLWRKESSDFYRANTPGADLG